MVLRSDDPTPFPHESDEEVAAFEAGEDTVRHESGGLTYAQAPYRYQVKCLRELRGAHAALSPAARAEVDPVLEATGCLAPLVST